ncbi:MAG TPA: AMP-binding protein [Acidimicrobiales bacterium]|jgi:fatty-acyl-CoA synthase|nr:AMP-binding protein [Acidimicrobiales bacterium]
MTGLAHAIGTTDTPLLEETIGAAFDRTVAAFGDREALVVPFQDVRLTYRGLAEQVDRLARGLMAAGMQTGDRLGMWSPNYAEWVYLQLAAAKVGAILVNINPAYQTEELRYALAQSGCRALVAATAFKSSDYKAMIDQVRPSLPELSDVVLLGTSSWDRLMAGGERVSDRELADRSASLGNRDPINIQYTSGTTGAPKGATLSHRNLLNNGFFCGEGFRYRADDRVCIPVPFYHCFGMVIGNLACVTHGTAIVVPAPSFEPGATLQAIEAERCTSVLGVPTMFISMLAHPEFTSFDLTSLRTGMMAGSPCPVEIMKQCVNEMHMGDVTIGYGMTETSPVSTQTSPDDPLEKRVSTVGRVHPHVEVKVVDPASGATVAIDEPGELCTKGYSVMLGYWNNPEGTAEAVDPEGWMHTGDLAVMDADQYVSVVGRIKDMIIRGGENVYPREVEEFLYRHPDIVDVQVIGVPDPKYGEELCAWVRLRDGATLTRDDIAAFCAGRIAHFKIPRYVHVTDQFPMTVTGKVQKYRMRQVSTELLAAGGLGS